jgi:hypothetical protein
MGQETTIMPLPPDVQFAEQRMLEAQGALRSYVEREMHDRDQHRALVAALDDAIHEYMAAVRNLAANIG